MSVYATEPGTRHSRDPIVDAAIPRHATCPFCRPTISDRVALDLGSVVAFEDGFPVTAGHYLVVPERHVEDFFLMSAEERSDAERALFILRERLSSEDPTIEGFNVGINCGTAAGQTVAHAHIHLIPRRSGDTPNPRGGIRGVIPGRMSY